MFLNSPNKFKIIIYTSTFLCLFVQILLSTPQPLPSIISADTSGSEILESATDILESGNTTNITGPISASLNVATNTTGQNSTSLNITTKDTTDEPSNSTELGINSNNITDSNSVNGTSTVGQADSSNITVDSTTDADATNSTMNSATNITFTNSIINNNSTTDADGTNPIANITVTNSTSNVNVTDSTTSEVGETISTTNVTVTNSTVNTNATNPTTNLNVTIGNATNQNVTLDNSTLGNGTNNTNLTASSLNSTNSLNTTKSNLTLGDITVNVTNQISNTVIPPNSTINGTNLTNIDGANTTNVNGTNVTNTNGTNSTNTNGSTLLSNTTNTTNSTLNGSNATNNATNNTTNSTTESTENYLIGLKGNLLFIPHTMNSKLVRKYENGSVETLWINDLAFSGNGTVDLSRNISLTQCEPDGIESDGLTTDDLTYFPFYTEFYTKILELNSTGQVNLTILDYDWRLPYFCIVPKIKDAVEQLYQRNNEKVNVIAHGTGGLIYMLAMNNETSITNQTNSVAFVGTPFEGQVWGYYQLWFGQTVKTNSQALDFTKIFTFGSIYSALCVDCFVDADNKTIEFDPYNTDGLIKNSFVRALISDEGDLEESATEITKKINGFRPIDSTVGTAAAKIQAISAYIGYAKQVQDALKYRTDINYPKLIVGLSKSDASTPSIIPLSVKGDSTVYLKADSEGEPGSRIFLDYQNSISSLGDGLTPYKNCRLDPQFNSTEILSNQTFMRLLDDKIMMQQLIAEMQ